MAEQSNPPDEAPETEGAAPDQAAAATEGEQPTAPPARRPAGEEGATAAALNDRGQAVAQVLQRVAAPHVVASGGRDDLPWVEVEPEHLVDVARRFKEHRDLRMDMLHCLLAVDYKDHIQVVCILLSLALNRKAILKVNLPLAGEADQPRLPSLTSVWEAAGWYERETHDLFGVVFEGNPDMTPLLLYEGFEGFPGRKSFPFHEYEEY